jgi:phosphohistidine phosphatase
MRIYILRHAIAEESAKGGDAQRALTDEGKRKMKEAAAGFAALDPDIDGVYTSPLVRAVQTAEIVARALGYKGKVEKMEQLAPGHSPDAVLTRLKTLEKKGVILAGHEPNCSELASYLLGDAVLQFKKGAICLIETETLQPRSGTLIWHFSPAILRSIEV